MQIPDGEEVGRGTTRHQGFSKPSKQYMNLDPASQNGHSLYGGCFSASNLAPYIYNALSLSEPTFEHPKRLCHALSKSTTSKVHLSTMIALYCYIPTTDSLPVAQQSRRPGLALLEPDGKTLQMRTGKPRPTLVPHQLHASEGKSTMKNVPLTPCLI